MIKVAFKLLVFSICTCICYPSFSQSPEILLREFASGQVKKGVRSIGMGGDGATVGNYSLVWRDSSTALIDAGVTRYSGNNLFSFTAVGVTTPDLWRGLVIYAIALSQNANNISMSLKSPGQWNGAIPVHGNGANQVLFIKAAMPLGKGFSIGVLLSYERSQFTAVGDTSYALGHGAVANNIQYQTGWLPSGGFGITWQPNKKILVGFRGLFNQDIEHINKNVKGLNLSHEYRLGIALGLWDGAMVDVGGNVRYRYNENYNTRSLASSPNIGFEQNFMHQLFALRTGVDESSFVAGGSLKLAIIVIDIAYVNNLGMARIGSLFGSGSNSVLTTCTFNFGKFIKKNKV